MGSIDGLTDELNSKASTNGLSNEAGLRIQGDKELQDALDDFVPYTGATANLDLGENALTVNASDGLKFILKSGTVTASPNYVAHALFMPGQAGPWRAQFEPNGYILNGTAFK